MKSKAYAKINLALKVLGKREDGYHDLEMVMENIDLYDEITFKKSDEIKIETSEYICEEKDNIVYKVASFLKDKYKINKGVHIYIKKNVPSGAGLGGGSSDAACTIISLNKFWKLNMKFEEMEEVANSLGSDILFFLYNSLSLIKGRGDIVKPINKYFEKEAFLIKPNFNASTALVYKSWEGETSSYDVSDLIANINKENVYDYMFNDLEKACLKAYPDYQLENIKEKLISYGAKKVIMSGSGSSVIAFVNNYNAYEEIKRESPDYSIFKIKTISYCVRF